MTTPLIFAGSGSPRLTAAICEQLGVNVGRGDVIRFSEGNLYVRVNESVRGQHVYVVQTIAFPANDNFMELLFWIDALKRSSAESVTVIIPYFSYAKGDKQDEPRVSIRARVCADALEAAGADHIVTLDMHSPQIQGFFHVPTDELQALIVLCDYVRQHIHLEGAGVVSTLPPQQLSQLLVVVSPDAGFAKRARRYADQLHATMAIGDKDRPAHDERAQVFELIGDVKHKTALIVDDFTLSCGSLVETARKLQERGATRILALVTHGVFATGSMEKLDASPIEQLIITDSVETQPVTLSPKVKVVSVAPLIAEAIRRIHHHESVSMLFPKKR
jgi:ribose-phosphate pyrophosphokinase